MYSIFIARFHAKVFHVRHELIAETHRQVKNDKENIIFSLKKKKKKIKNTDWPFCSEQLFLR